MKHILFVDGCTRALSCDSPTPSELRGRSSVGPVQPVGILTEALDAGGQGVEREGFLHARMDHRRHETIPACRHRDDRAMVLVLAESAREAMAIETRHVQVEEDEARARAALQAVERFDAIRSADCSAAQVLEAARQRLPDAGIVFDDEDGALARHAVNVDTHAWDCT